MQATMLFPIRCLLPLDTPQVDVATRERMAVVTWPDGLRQRVAVLQEDVVLQEARVRYWVRVNGRAEAMEQFVPSDWIESED